MTAPQHGFPVVLPSDSPAPASIEYELSTQELAAAFVHNSQQNRAIARLEQRRIFRNVLRLAWHLVAVAVWIGAVQLMLEDRLIRFVIPVSAALVYWIGLLILVRMDRRALAERLAGANRRMYENLAHDPAYQRVRGPYRVEINSEGVTQSSATRSLRAKWGSIDEIIADENMSYFASGSAGQVAVPRRAFVDEQAYWAFVRQARDYREASIRQDRESEREGEAPAEPNRS